MSAEENQPTTPTNPTPPTTPRKVSKLTPNTKGDGRTLPKLPPSIHSSQSQGDNSSFINLNNPYVMGSSYHDGYLIDRDGGGGGDDGGGDDGYRGSNGNNRSKGNNEKPNEEKNDIKPTTWDDAFEKICADMIDEAQINTFLHIKSHRYYSKWSRNFQIPIILLSAIVGSANFASNNFGKQKENVILAVGAISIVISIISSIAQYLKLAELKESHRISSFHWEKFYSKIKVQLMLTRGARRRLPDFYDDITTEYHRLKEISPIFTNKISQSARKNEGYEYLNIPFYLNGFRPVVPYEKAQEDFRYYYLTNNVNKLINGQSSLPELTNRSNRKIIENNQRNGNMSNIPSTDPDLMKSQFWDTSTA